MLRGVGIAAVAALVAVPVGVTGVRSTPPVVGPITPGDDTATAVLSSNLHGARPVALTIRLHAELRCGRLSSKTLTVSLPSSMHVPSSVSTTAVTVSGEIAGSVGTNATRVVIHPAAPKPGAICDVIGPGVVPIKFTRRAGLGNPVRTGSYAFEVVTTPGSIWHGSLTIR